MRRTCERPGCGGPSAVIYGYGTSGSDTMWLDAWHPDRDPSDAPADTRGVVCARHGELLGPPRGWTIDDRRDSVPRLFKPRDRGVLSVVPPTPDDTPKVKRDPTAPTRRPKSSDRPRPRLFSDLEEQVAPAPAVPPVVESVVEPVAESVAVDPDDSTELLIQQDVGRRVTATFDPDDDLGGTLDATGPMLRDAFRSRHSGRWDPTAELMRPTDVAPENS
ncbi:MAG: hypothetical protein ACKOCE_08660 [Acidimicrobiia bacterium]